MEKLLSESRAKATELVRRPETFLHAQSDLFETAKALTKVLYDIAKLGESSSERTSLDTLPELIVEDFDEEQVWAGVEMQNRARFESLCTRVSHLAGLHERKDFGGSLLLGESEISRTKRKLEESNEDDDDEEEDHSKRVHFENDQEEEEEDEEDDDDPEEEEEEDEEKEPSDDDEVSDLEDDDPILNDPDFQHMSDSDGDDLPLFANALSEDEEEDDGEDEEEEEDNGESKETKKKRDVDVQADEYLKNAMLSVTGKQRGDEVEDRFFKLDEMEKFLETEDTREERRRLREEKGMNSEDEYDGLDLFGETVGSEAEERVRYKDYFGGGESAAAVVADADENDDSDEDEDEDEEEEKEVSFRKDSRVSAGIFAEEEEEEKDLGEIKSTFEETQLRMRKKIKKLEEEAISEKPWQLSGEIAGPARPENSLLQEHLDYDTVARQAPIITEEVSKKLEDIIVQRIKDRAWDDVERKIKPVEDPYAYKKRMVLDHEKSKLSLAQIYEQEFLQQQSKLEEGGKLKSIIDQDDPTTAESVKEVEEIQGNMKKLFTKLDALTHFHYTPKSLTTEVKVIRNLPSIAMEEVAPVSANDAALLAPQEVVDSRKGEMIGISERTETDRKRARRKKKANQRTVKIDKEKKGKKVGGKKDGKKDKKVSSSAGKEVRSSTAFFDQLQHETSNFAKEKAQSGKKKKKTGTGVHAANLKL